MKYQSPIHLISDKNLNTITPENLKKWRKEILLRFSMTSETVISVNGREYDKQSINDAFEELKNDFDLHISLFRNPSLLAFIESGDLAFFRNQKAQDELVYGGFRNKTYDLFAERYGQIVYQAIENRNEDNLHKLKVLKHSRVEIDQEKEVETFAKGFSTFSAFIEKFKLDADDCFEAPNHRRLKPVISEYVNKDVRELIKNLPSSFDSLKQNYASVIRGKLLNQAFGDNSQKLLKAEKSTLNTLLTAAQTDKDILNKSDIDNIIRSLRQILNGEIKTPRRDNRYQETSSSSSGSNIWAIIAAVVLLVRVAIYTARCSQDNNRRQYNSNRSYTPRYNNTQTYIPKKKYKPKTYGYQKPAKKSDVKEAYKQTESTDVTNLKFNPQDLLGNWEINRTATDSTDAQITYNYAFSNYSEGKRTITFQEPGGKYYSVEQAFNYSAKPDNYYSGKLHIIVKNTRYKSCTNAEGQRLLRLAESRRELEFGHFSKNIFVDFSIPSNKNIGISLGQETFELALGEGDVSNYNKGKIRDRYIVKYINNLLEKRGASLGPTNVPFRFYADKTAKYLVGKSRSHTDTIAEIKISPTGKIYLKEIIGKVNEKYNPCLEVEQVNFKDARGRYRRGTMMIYYQRKKGFLAKIK